MVVMAPSAASGESQLVVIGSSAGGIEALSRVVASLPADFPAPIVIAQHLDPRRPSHLHEILARHATLPVRIVEEKEPLEGGVIFVVPSNRIVDVSHGDLRLRAAKAGSVAPSVDVLLESAAGVFGSGLIAVILTGSGSDGSAGAWHVKKAGGSVVIENPATAMFPSMPSSIPPSLVDATADLDSIGSVVCDLLAAGNPPAGEPDHVELRDLLDRIHERSGIDFGSYKPATIQRRLRGRLSATGSPNLAAYAAYLESDTAEYARLVNSFLIKVTEFFRDPKVFDYLRAKVLPELIAEAMREGRELRIWSAGCATGEEAYSLAIVVAEAVGDDLPWPKVRIFATDVDRQAIDFARRGIYPPGAIKGLPVDTRNRYFVKSGRGLRSRQAAALPDGLQRARSGREGIASEHRSAPLPERTDLLRRSNATSRAGNVRRLVAPGRAPRSRRVRERGGPPRPLRGGAVAARRLPSAARQQRDYAGSGRARCPTDARIAA